MSDNINKIPPLIDNIQMAKRFSNYVKTTLGPRGNDKMFIKKGSGELPDQISITNDGATIVQKVKTDHHIGQFMIKLARNQDIEVGDGTTTTIIMAGDLLYNAVPLLEKGMKPQKIIDGYKLGAELSKKYYEEISRDYQESDIEFLIKTSLTGKVAYDDNIISKITPVLIAMENKDDIILQPITGSEGVDVYHGYLIDNNILTKEMPQERENANVLIFKENLEIQSNDITAQQQYKYTELEKFSNQKSDIYSKWVTELKNNGVDIIFTTGQVNALMEGFLEKQGISCVKRMHEEKIEILKKLTGAKPIKSLKLVTPDVLGMCDYKTLKINDEDYLHIDHHNSIMTIVIRGSNSEYTDEVKRCLEDSIKVISTVKKSKKILTGAGSCELYVANKLRDYAKTINAKEQLVLEKFADTLEEIPTQLALSSGFDAIDLFVEARVKNRENKNIGIDVYKGAVRDMSEVIEPLKLKTSCLNSASDICKTLLRVDSVDYEK